MPFVLALLPPTLAWLTGFLLADTRRPSPVRMAALGTVAGPGVARWLHRPPVEQAALWVVGVVAWGSVTVARNGGAFVAFSILSGSACLVLAARVAGASATPAAALAAVVSPSDRPAPPPPAPRTPDEESELAFLIALRCPNCGAGVPVPVHQHMARCPFCASEHLVLRQGAIVTAVVPDAVNDEAALRAAVAAHFGHLRYLELYDRRVRPLVAEQERESEPPLAAVIGAAATVAIDTVEAAVRAEADTYAAALSGRLQLRRWDRFLSPYWHRFGTLYLAGFGRDRSGAKRLELAVTTVESSIPATPAPLPEMGKLSYLRILRPLAGSPEAELPALSVERPLAALEERMQQLARRSSQLPIEPIARRATLVPEVTALVYRPWHLVDAEVDGEIASLLVDGAAASVAGPAPAIGTGEMKPAPPGDEPISLTASRCPECGAALGFAPDAVAHLCRNCFRLVELRAGTLRALPYLREAVAPSTRLLPFWRFPLRLRTPDGALVTDIAHLTDGVDGVLDQIGAAPMREQHLFVPAFRIRIGRAGITLLRRLWPFLAGQAHELMAERYSPADAQRHATDVTLPAEEARVFAMTYLTLAFTPRDLARARLRSVRAGFLAASLEGRPELAFLAVPDGLMPPSLQVLGRALPAAVASLPLPRSSPAARGATP